MTSKDIEKLLFKKYVKPEKYVLPNVYVFSHFWESDVFVLRQSGLCMEFEIKVSKSDFNADFKKKEKHQVLAKGTYEVAWYKGGVPMITNKVCPRPNLFYYVVPEALVSVTEVPAYAGLIYVKEYTDFGGRTYHHLMEIKKAPYLHKEKISLTLIQKVMDKIYYKFLNTYK